MMVPIQRYIQRKKKRQCVIFFFRQIFKDSIYFKKFCSRHHRSDSDGVISSTIAKVTSQPGRTHVIQGIYEATFWDFELVAQTTSSWNDSLAFFTYNLKFIANIGTTAWLGMSLGGNRVIDGLRVRLNFEQTVKRISEGPIVMRFAVKWCWLVHSIAIFTPSF